MSRVYTRIRTTPFEWHGSNELRRYSKYVWVQPRLRIFGRTFALGAETLGYEFAIEPPKVAV